MTSPVRSSPPTVDSANLIRCLRCAAYYPRGRGHSSLSISQTLHPQTLQEPAPSSHWRLTRPHFRAFAQGSAGRRLRRRPQREIGTGGSGKTHKAGVLLTNARGDMLMKAIYASGVLATAIVIRSPPPHSSSHRHRRVAATLERQRPDRMDGRRGARRRGPAHRRRTGAMESRGRRAHRRSGHRARRPRDHHGSSRTSISI